MQRSEEHWNVISHAIGIPLGLLALILLLNSQRAQDSALFFWAALVYGLTFIMVYLASSLYHLGYRAPATMRYRLQLWDHLSIYLFIAGTYTPVAIFALPEGWNWGIVTTIWILAAAGSWFKWRSLGRFKKISLLFYLLMGWLIIVALRPLISTAPLPLLYWLLAGGLFYSLGTIFFSWQRLRYNHAIWHLFVLTGSLCHWAGIYWYLPV